MKSILQLVSKVHGALTLFVFLFGVIIFYRYMSASAITHYRVIIVPIVLLLAGKLFKNAMTPSTEEAYQPNIQIEKIRLSLVYTAFVAFVFVMYSVDLGGVLREYLGPGFVATLLLLSIGGVYLLTLLSYPIIKAADGTTNTSGLLSGLTKFGISHAVFFFVTIALMIVGVVMNLGEFTDNGGQLRFKGTRGAQLFSVTGSLFGMWDGFYTVNAFREM